MEEAVKNRKQRSHRHRGMQKTKMMLQKRMRRELTLQIQKSLMIRKMYTKMVRIPVLHRDLEDAITVQVTLANDEITDIQVTKCTG